MPRSVLEKNQEKVRTKHEAIDDAIDRRVAAHLQAQRIEAYLPTLRARRDELDELIRDEEAAVAEIMSAVK